MAKLNDSIIQAVRRAASLPNKVALTYDSTKLTDGAGAQLQRIYGTYSISRLSTPPISIPRSTASTTKDFLPWSGM
jgi:hypothetical protein